MKKHRWMLERYEPRIFAHPKQYSTYQVTELSVSLQKHPVFVVVCFCFLFRFFKEGRTHAL